MQILVGGRTAGTPAGESGIEFKDEVRMYAVASMDAIGDVKEVTSSEDSGMLSKKFDEAQHAKKSVILMIWRLSRTRV